MAARSTHLVLIVAQLCFASLAVVGRLAVGHIPPAGIPLVRCVAGALVFALIAWQRGALRFHRRDLGLALACAVLGVAANQTLFILGLARSTAVNASVLGSTIPVFTLIVAIAVGRERVTARRVIGIAIAFAAVAILVGVDRVSVDEGHLLGSGLILLNSACYGAYLVIARPLSQRMDPFALLAVLFGLGIPLVAPLGIHAFATSPALDANDYGLLVFIVIVPTIAAYALIQIALRRAEATLVAAYVYLQPVIAMLGAMALLGEQPTSRFFMCAPFVILGVYICTSVRKPQVD